MSIPAEDFRSIARTHINGGAVKANMVAGFITALQSAVLAVENELGTTAARNYVRKDGAVTVTGLKTFQDGAEFGSGTKSLPPGLRTRKPSDDRSFAIGIRSNVVYRAARHHEMDNDLRPSSVPTMEAPRFK